MRFLKYGFIWVLLSYCLSVDMSFGENSWFHSIDSCFKKLVMCLKKNKSDYLYSRKTRHSIRSWLPRYSSVTFGSHHARSTVETLEQTNTRYLLKSFCLTFIFELNSFISSNGPPVLGFYGTMRLFSENFKNRKSFDF